MFFEGKALEFLIAAVVALVVVGPKDLPILLRKFGQFMARVRAMANEFRASFDEMARQSELDQLRKEVEAMRKEPAFAQAIDTTLDVDKPDHRDRLWSVKDSPLVYYVTHLGTARKVRATQCQRYAANRLSEML